MAWNDGHRRQPVPVTQEERDTTAVELRHIAELASILAVGVQESSLAPYACTYWLRRYITQKIREITDRTGEPPSTDIARIEQRVATRLRY